MSCWEGRFDPVVVRSVILSLALLLNRLAASAGLEIEGWRDNYRLPIARPLVILHLVGSSPPQWLDGKGPAFTTVPSSV